MLMRTFIFHISYKKLLTIIYLHLLNSLSRKYCLYTFEHYNIIHILDLHKVSKNFTPLYLSQIISLLKKKFFFLKYFIWKQCYSQLPYTK